MPQTIPATMFWCAQCTEKNHIYLKAGQKILLQNSGVSA